MHSRHFVLSAHILMFIGGIAAAAQPTPSTPPSKSAERFSVGAYGGWCVNLFDGAFSVERNGAISEASDCGRFEKGSGSSPVFGVMVEGPLSDRLRWGVMAEYHRRNGTLSFPCVDPASTRLPNGTVVSALTDHIADVDYTAIATRLLLGYQPLPIPLQISVGPVLSLVAPGDYDAREEIVTPSNAEFLSGGQVLPYGSASFATGMHLSFGLSAGLSYRAKIAEQLSLMPEVSGLLALSDDIPEARLRSNHLQGTIGILYRFDREETSPDPPPVAAKKPDEPANLDVTLSARAVDPEGNATATVDVEQVGVISTKLFPLLTYIFFDEGSGEIPSRYIRRSSSDATTFNEGMLRDENTLGIYYNLLDIIGLRMQRVPDAKITVTGTQPDAPGGDKLPLASERAGTVKEYLVSRWKIDPSRIAIATRVEPATRSNPDTRDGAAENRRVEITSDSYPIIEPLLLADTAVVNVASKVILSPRASSDAGIDNWSINVNGGKKHDAIFGGSGIPPAHLELPHDFITNATDTRPTHLGMLLTVRDRAGEERSDSMSMSVRWINKLREHRYGAGTYSLILFDFNSSELRDEHRRIVDLVNARIEPGAHASVYGYTDILGSDELNKTLSEQRAQAVAKSIAAELDEIAGRGETTLLYDNSLPEGRFYSRSVTIETKTP